LICINIRIAFDKPKGLLLMLWTAPASVQRCHDLVRSSRLAMFGRYRPGSNRHIAKVTRLTPKRTLANRKNSPQLRRLTTTELLLAGQLLLNEYFHQGNRAI
jgi:hypothetical protein